LGTLGGGWGSTWAQDINNSGQIIGTSELSSGYWHAFLTSPYTPINPATDDLGPIGGNSGAAAINAHGQVVGNISMDSYPWDTSHTHAFLYSDSTMIDLNTLIDPLSGWTLQSATDINDSGQIVGWGVGPNFGPNEAHAFLLTPIPEPSILILLGITSVSLLVFKLASSTKRCYYRL
jgi:probable HAF family extracellular repeat protein